MAQEIVTFNHVSKYFKNIKLLKNVSFSIYEGEIALLIGVSGSGKSTIHKLLLGFFTPEGGEIYYRGKKQRGKASKEKRKEIGFVAQENTFYEKLTVHENLVFFGSAYGISKRVIYSRISFLLDLIQLGSYEHSLAETLSGGMKRRLEFAISLIHDPSLLILDEPFVGLDILIRQELWDLLEKIRKMGVTVLISTHLLHFSQKYADRVLILDKGSIKEDILLRGLGKTGTETLNLENHFLEVVRQ